MLTLSTILKLMKGRDFLSFNDITKQEILAIFELTRDLKLMRYGGEEKAFLSNKTLAMIFQKPSTRTRASFENGMSQLGGHSGYYRWDDLQISRGEPISDVARIMSSYSDGIMCRLFSHDDAVEIAKHASVPVINGLTDLEHPCQALTDVFTMLEVKGFLRGLNIAYLGDAENNVCHSLMLACARLGINLRIGAPSKYFPNIDILNIARTMAKNNGSYIEITEDSAEAVRNADVVYTDVWISMGDEATQDERVADLKPYQVNQDLMKNAKENAVFMHDMPAKRGYEVTADVMDGSQSVVFQQGENRLHVQKALLVCLL